MPIADCAGFDGLLDRLLGEFRMELSRKHRLDMEGLAEIIDCEAAARKLPDLRVEAFHATLAELHTRPPRNFGTTSGGYASNEPQECTEREFPPMTAELSLTSASSHASPPAIMLRQPYIRQSSSRASSIAVSLSKSTEGLQIIQAGSVRDSLSQSSKLGFHQKSMNSYNSSNANHTTSIARHKSSSGSAAKGRKRTWASRVSAALQPNTPDATSRVVWDVVMCGVMLLLILIETTSFAIPEWQEGTFAYGWGIFLLVVFMTDILINFNTALVWIVGRKVVIIYDRWQIAKAYFKSWFIIDAFTAVPFDLVLGDMISASNARTLKIGKILRMARLIRGFVKITRLMQHWGEIQESIQEKIVEDLLGCQGYQIDKAAKYVWRAWGLLFCLLAESHVFACLLLVLSQNVQSMSWRTSGTDIHELDPYSRYVVALRNILYILATGTVDVNAGFHDILLTVLVVWFYIHLTIVIAIFVGIKSDPGLSDEDFSIKCSRLRRYLRRHNVVKRVRDEVDSHLSKVGKYVGMNLDSLLEELPSAIRQSVCAGLYYPFYERMAFFMQCSTSEAFEYDICVSIQALFYRPLDQVVAKGFPLHGLYYLSEGLGAISLPSPTILQEEADWNSGEYLFLEALFAPRPLCESSGDVDAVEPCEVWFLARVDFDRLLQETHSSVRKRVELVRSKVQFSEQLYSWVLEVIGEDGEIQYIGMDYLVDDGRLPEISSDSDENPSRDLDARVDIQSPMRGFRLPLGKRFHYFLSHRKQHSKLGNRPELIAQSLHDALDSHGFTGFFDVDDLVEISRPALEEAVRESCAMIVIINDETAESEWCRLEWECAAKNGIPVKCVVDAQHSCKADLLNSIREINPALLQYQWSEYLDRYRKSVAKDLVDWLRNTVPSSQKNSMLFNSGDLLVGGTSTLGSLSSQLGTLANSSGVASFSTPRLKPALSQGQMRRMESIEDSDGDGETLQESDKAAEKEENSDLIL